MPRSFDHLKVFVSSTSEDLQVHRAVARQVILDLDWHPTMMEHFGTSTEPTVEACLERLADCDLVLLIVAFRQGWVPNREQGGDGVQSITALELQHARDKGIPVIALLASESWPGNLWENEQASREAVERFRDELNLLAVFFEHEVTTTQEAKRLPAFRAKVREELVAHKQRLIRDTAPSTPAQTDLEHLERARHLLLEGQVIPFLGTGISRGGPLCSEVLARALAGDDFSEASPSLATAAEYCERLNYVRQLFLKKLKTTIETQQKAADEFSGRFYDLLVSLENIPLIVSTTCDNLLEQRILQANKTYAIVSHIIRSEDGRHDGKILVVRDDGSAAICLADQMDLPDVDHVIYRPLGSPFVHEKLDPKWGMIDTVVITESDHLTFLGRLENEHTRIPAKFIRWFLSRPILFIGYALDVWQYRLVMQVFHTVGIQGRYGSILAVRVPDRPMELMAWERLGADLVPMEPDQFANDYI